MTSVEQAAGRVVVGVARRPGTEPPCADGQDVLRLGQRVCAAVVDGAGHRKSTVRYVGIAPAVMTHLGMTLGGLPGLMTAGQMAEAYDVPPHVSAVYADMEPGIPTSVHWIGDCRAYGWDGAALTLWSTDQTMGQWIRICGGPAVRLDDDAASTPNEEAAVEHDHWARLGLEQASAATCRQIQIPQDVRLVLLVTDGISDQVDQETVETLCRTHAADPQALADALTAAAEADDEGYRDDATVVALALVS